MNCKPWYRSSTLWIFSGLILGVVLGGFLPSDRFPFAYESFRFLSKAFISLIKSIIVPILVATVITGIAQTGDIKAVGRMGGKALLYFEVVTTAALVIGLAVANWIKPGAGLPLKSTEHIALVAQKSGWETALHAFPSNFFKHAAEADVLPVVIFAALIGIAITKTPEKGRPVLAFFEGLAQVMFRYTDMIMSLTPVGVFGAMAYNVSHMASGQTINGVYIQGWHAVAHLLGQYAKLVGSLYLALILLVVLVFIPVMLLFRIPVVGFFRAIKDPALTAYSTASSEAALPILLEEMVAFGVPRRVASFVIPTGYSFNLDGSTLYLVLASLAIAQAAGIHMSLWQQISMMLMFMLTSKGVAGVPRATLVIIAATCASFGLPGEAGVAMILAVDEIMDMARTTVNVTGNGLASAVLARWEGVFGSELPEAELGPKGPAAVQPV